MSVFKELEAHRTGLNHVDELSKRLVISVEQLATPYTDLSYMEEWCVYAKIGVNFRCHKGDYENGRKRADHIIATRLYSDALSRLEEIKFSIDNGDRREALLGINELIHSLTG